MNQKDQYKKVENYKIYEPVNVARLENRYLNKVIYFFF